MMDSIFENPIALLFISYAIGANIDPMLRNTAFYKRISSLNYLGDNATKYIGVLLLGRIIKATPLRMFNTSLFLDGKPSEEELLQLKTEMSGAEIGHLIGFIVLSIYCLICVVAGKSWTLIAIILIVNVFFNLHLVFLQQYNKRRVDRLLKVLQRRQRTPTLSR